MLSYHGLVLPLSLLLVACSGSDDDLDLVDRGVPPPEEGATALSSSAVCRVRNHPDILIGAVDGDADPGTPGEEPLAGPDATASEDLVDCLAPPRTDLSSSGLSPTGSGTLRVGDREYALSSALRGIGPLPTPLYGGGPPRRRYNDLVLHDGETRVRRHVDAADGRRIDYGVYDGGVALAVTLLTRRAAGDPSGRVYDLVPESTIEQEQALLERDIATDAVLMLDRDGNGTISAPERFIPSSGQVVWSETKEAPSLTFVFVLEDGRSIEGAYEGGYELVDLAAIALDD